MITHFVGVDVQTARGCACAVLRDDGTSVATTWQSQAAPLMTAVREILAADHGSLRTSAVGIDSPRVALQRARNHYWDGGKNRWRERGKTDVGHGRHCEVVVSALGLANPQWTPLLELAPAWMSLGFSLFQAFSEATVHEVFATASYKLFARSSVKLEIDLTHFTIGPKDMLDAFVCAATVREFELGNGCAVGNGDGLGSIILPRRPERSDAGLLEWPGGTNSA